MATFSDFYKQQMSAAPTPPQRTSAASSLPQFNLSNVKKASDSAPQSPLNWLIDIISRPLYAATDTVTGVGEAIARTQEGKNPLEIAGAIAEHNPLTGLLSTDSNNKKTYGDVMENLTDRFGALNNPGYVDRENNVDQVVKGVFGFAGDVLLDPLTYVPGGLIAKGAKAGVNAAKSGADALGTAVKGTKAAEVAAPAVKAAEDLPVGAAQIDEADNVFGGGFQHTDIPSSAPKVEATPIPQAADFGPVKSWAQGSRVSEVSKAWSAYNKLAAKGGDFLKGDDLAKAEGHLVALYNKHLGPAADTTAKLAPKVAPGSRTFTEVFKSAPHAPTLRAELSSLLEAGSEQAAKAQPMGDWVKSNFKKNLFDEATIPSPQLANLLSGVGKLPAGSVGRLAQISQNAQVPEAIRQEATGILRKQYGESSKSSTAVTDALTAFSLRAQKDSSSFESLIGPGLFDMLQKKTDPSKFRQSVEKIVKVMDPEADPVFVERFFKSEQALGNALADSLWVPRFVKDTANSVDDVAAAKAAVSSVQSAADEAMARTLQTQTPAGGKVFEQQYPVADRGVNFTEADTVIRTARFKKQLNTFFQYNLIRNLDKAMLARMGVRTGQDAKKLMGALRESEWRAAFYEHGEAMARTLDTLGIKLHIGQGTQKLVPLSVFDVFRTVEAGFDDAAVASKALFNYGTSVAPTRLMEAAHFATTSGLHGDELLAGVSEILRNKKLTGYRGQVLDQNIPNNALKPGGVMAHFPGKNQRGAAEALAAKVPGSKVVAGKNGGWSVRTGPGGIIDPLALAVTRSAGALLAKASDNAAAYAARGVAETKNLTAKQITELTELIGDGDFARIVDTIGNMHKPLSEAGSEMGAFPSSVLAAEETVKLAVGERLVNQAKALRAAEVSVKSGSKTRPVAVAESSQKVSDEVFDEAMELVEQTMDDVVGTPAARIVVDENSPAIDLASMYAEPVARQQGFVSRMLGGFADTFDQTRGIKSLWNTYHSKKTVAGQYLDRQVAHLRELRKFDPEVQVAAIKALQSGVPNSNAEIQGAVKVVDDILKSIFDTSGSNGSLLSNKILSTEGDLGHINDILKMKGLSDDFRFTENLDEWRQWDITDPTRTLLSLSDAAATVVEHRALVGDFVSTMKKAGFISKEPKSGFVRLTDSGGSTFGKLIPEGVYVDRAMANELHRLDVLTRTSREFQGEVGEFLRKTYLPAQSIWKQLVTVFRPGHHLRNINGNSFMSWIDRGNKHYASSYKDAFRVLGLRNNYSDMDIVSSLQRTSGDAIPTGGDVIVRGRFGDMTADEVYAIAQDNGLFSTYAASEDLMLEQGLGRIAKLGTDITNSRLGQAAGTVSHAIDHHGKLQHLIQILKQEAGTGRYAKYGKLSKEKTIQRAIRDVKRSHPDALMLTPAEAKMRFLVPFYTWFAKTLPFAMESMARNPGRVSVIPKASYNLAVAMGVNPDSLSDPFPTDQMFPSYLTQDGFGPQLLGPDGQYINVNPGVPQFDLLKSLGGPDDILGMISPLIRVPAELASGAKWGSQAPIRDTSDYLDQNLPIVNYIANMTGTSVTGSLASALQGQGLDPQAQVAKGNKDGFDQGLSIASWLSGLNPQNWSRPNIINYAEIEARNRAGGSGNGF